MEFYAHFSLCLVITLFIETVTKTRSDTSCSNSDRLDNVFLSILPTMFRSSDLQELPAAS